MKNKKLMIAVAAITMCATSAFALSACGEKHEHNYQDWKVTKEPTCMEKGLEQGTCPDDGETTTRPVDIDPDAHKFGDWNITAPTSTDAGKAIKTCENNSLHVAEITLPALTPENLDLKYTYGEKDEDDKYTFTFKDDATIQFKQSLEHLYKGELTLVKAPTLTQPGYATKACTEEGHDDILNIYIPALGSNSESISVSATTQPTATTCGKGTYTYTHTNGEKLLFTEQEIPATATLDDTFISKFEEKEYNSLDSAGNPMTVSRHVSTDKNSVGKVEGAVTSYGWPSNYSYEFGDGYTHINDPESSSDYYYYYGEAVDGVVHGIEKYSYAETPVMSDRIHDGRLDGKAFSTGSAFENTFYGMDGLLYGLYEHRNDPESSGFSYGSHTVDEKTVYTFGYTRFVQSVYDGASEKQKSYWEYLYFISVDYTLSSSGIIDSFKVTLNSYSTSYMTEHADQDSAPEGASYSFVPEALSDSNPIRGYETGNFYVLNGTSPNTTEITGTVTLKDDMTEKVESPYDFGNFELNDTYKLSYNLNDGNNTQLDTSKPIEITANTSDTVNFAFSDITPEELAAITTAKLFYKDGEEWKAIDYSSPVSGYVSWSSSSAFTLYCRNFAGDQQIRVVYGSITVDITLHIEYSEPEQITGQIYTNDDVSEKYVFATGDSVEIYAGESVCFDTVTAPTGNGGATNPACTITANGTELTEKVTVDGKELWKFTPDAAGTYEIIVKSTVKDTVTDTLTITVKAAPAESELFAGKYKNGSSLIEFKENNTLSITDKMATANYSYTYNAATKAFTLTKTSGDSAYEYTLTVTSKYNLKLSYTVSGNVHSNIFTKVIESNVDALLAGTTWTHSVNGMVSYEATVTFGSEGNTLKIEGNEKFPRTEDWEYSVTKIEGNKYYLAFKFISSSNGNPPQLGIKEELTGSYVVVENNQVKSFALMFQGFMEQSAQLVEMQKPSSGGDVDVNIDDLYAMLEEKSFYAATGEHFKTYSFFGDLCIDLFGSEEEDVGSYSYQLTAAPDGKIMLSLSGDSFIEASLSIADYNAINAGSYLVIEGGEVKAIVLSFSSGNVTYEAQTGPKGNN